jgi:hypothetical protein
MLRGSHESDPQNDVVAQRVAASAAGTGIFAHHLNPKHTIIEFY